MQVKTNVRAGGSGVRVEVKIPGVKKVEVRTPSVRVKIGG